MFFISFTFLFILSWVTDHFLPKDVADTIRQSRRRIPSGQQKRTARFKQCFKHIGTAKKVTMMKPDTMTLSKHSSVGADILVVANPPKQEQLP
jgi:hypothetical protein